MKRRLFAMLLVLALLCTGCGGGSSGSGGDDGGKRTSMTIISDEWYGTDMFQNDTWCGAQGLIADTLFVIDPETGDLSPRICTDLQTSEDGKTMRFTVPEGMYYATGEQVEPEDIIASLEYGQEVSPYAEGYDNIESMDVEGRDVVLHLTEYRSDMLYYLGECFIGVIDKDQLDSMSKEELLWGAVPYGQYSVENYISGSEVQLKANPGYKTSCTLVDNKGPAKLDTVTVKFTSEEFTVLTALKEGDVDIVSVLSMDGVAELKDSPDITVVDSTYPNIEYFELNTDSKQLSDIRVRKAILLGIDREQLAELSEGAAAPAYSMIYDTVQNFSQEAKDYFKKNYCNDPEQAKKLLAEAGYKDSDGDGYVDKGGKPLEFTFYVRSSGTSVIVAQGMQLQMKSIGIKMNIETIDWNYIYEQISSDDYDAGIEVLEWAEPILVLQSCFYDKNGLADPAAYKDEVKAAAATVDYDQRTEALAEIQKQIFDQVNCIPLYSDVSYMGYRNDLKGLKIFSNGTAFYNDIE